MRLLTAGALAALLTLCACGSAAGREPGRPSPAPSEPSAPPAGNALTVQDSGRTITLRPGEAISVALAEEPGFQAWTRPTSSNPGVLTPQVDPRAAAAKEMTLATFKAVGKGNADLQSGAGMACSPGMACIQIARVWQVHVLVDTSPGS